MLAFLNRDSLAETGRVDIYYILLRLTILCTWNGKYRAGYPTVALKLRGSSLGASSSLTRCHSSLLHRSHCFTIFDTASPPPLPAVPRLMDWSHGISPGVVFSLVNTITARVQNIKVYRVRLCLSFLDIIKLHCLLTVRRGDVGTWNSDAMSSLVH